MEACRWQWRHIGPRTSSGQDHRGKTRTNLGCGLHTNQVVLAPSVRRELEAKVRWVLQQSMLADIGFKEFGGPDGRLKHVAGDPAHGDAEIAASRWLAARQGNFDRD